MKECVLISDWMRDSVSLLQAGGFYPFSFKAKLEWADHKERGL